MEYVYIGLVSLCIHFKSGVRCRTVDQSGIVYSSEAECVNKLMKDYRYEKGDVKVSCTEIPFYQDFQKKFVNEYINKQVVKDNKAALELSINNTKR